MPVALMPHGSCFLWNPSLTALHVVSDAAVFFAYLSIPALLILNRQYVTVRARPLLLLFALFILSCGVGHLLAAWNIWHSDYWLEGIWKLITAAVSAYTVIELRQLLPQLLNTQKSLELAQLDSQTDPLTGLANRRALDRALSLLVSNQRHRSGTDVFMLFDLDGFKEINDLFGHPAGDRVLCNISQILRDNLPSDSSFAARLGGDEFAILLKNASIQSAVEIAEQLRFLIMAIGADADWLQPGGDGGSNSLVGASFGIAEIGKYCTSGLEIYQQADQALYQAKAAGKNQTALFQPPTVVSK